MDVSRDAAPVCVPEFPLEAVGGAVALDSSYYVAREEDQIFYEAVDEPGGIVLIKGARQMGKTSLLARGLQRARQRGEWVVFVDFQKLNDACVRDATCFYGVLADSFADRLDLDDPPDFREGRLSPAEAFQRYLREAVLTADDGSVLWAMDEVDRIFTAGFSDEFFGMIRAWHGERATDPNSPWRRLQVAISYATEAHLFISDINMSPFNVGHRLVMSDFTPDQVADLNRRYGAPLRHPEESEGFYELLHGQPYLVRRSLHEMVVERMSYADLEAQAATDEHLFSDHLRRLLLLLTKDEQLVAIVRAVLNDDCVHDGPDANRLVSAGLMRRDGDRRLAFRCGLYRRFLSDHWV